MWWLGDDLPGMKHRYTTDLQLSAIHVSNDTGFPGFS